MGRYMLDTDTCSYIMRRSNVLVLKQLLNFCNYLASTTIFSLSPACGRSWAE